MHPDLSDIGVIFDMDGVLVDSADAHFRSWQLLMEENGRTVTRDQFAGTFGRQNRDIVPILFGNVSPQRLQELSQRKEQIYRDLIRDCVPLVRGARELVVALHEAGARLAIGSSGPGENIQLVLQALKAADFFDAVISADQVTRGKPDPQVFELACKGLGLLPHRCVVVEDAPVGVTAAKSAGTKAIAVLIHHAAGDFPHADLTTSTLADLTVKSIKETVDGK